MSDPINKVRKPSRPGRPARPTMRPAATPQGPEYITKILNRKDRYRLNGPGEPPGGFVTATTSKDEWFVYWAMAKIFNDPPDPRQQPFFGGYSWGYQIAEQGGRQASGGAVVDFIAYTATDVIGLRIQTEYFHVYANAQKQGYDTNQRERLQRGGNMLIVDVFSQDFIDDITGQTAIVVLKSALGLVERQNPQIAGSARRSRFGRLQG